MAVGCQKQELVIRTPDDAAHARIGVMTGSTGEVLAKNRFPEARIQSYDSIPDTIAALGAGNVDAVVGAYRNFEATELDLQGKKAVTFFPEENGVPAYDELIFATRTALVGDARERTAPAQPRAGRLVDLGRPVERLGEAVAAGGNLGQRLRPGTQIGVGIGQVRILADHADLDRREQRDPP